jgi:hypothetical protein
VPIEFRCSLCERRLSIATRKSGTQIACPNCGTAQTVPGAPPAETLDAPASPLRTVLLTACVAVFLFGGLALALTLALRKPANRDHEQASAPQAAAQTRTTPESVPPQKPAQQQPQQSPNNPQQPEPTPKQETPQTQTPVVSPSQQPQSQPQQPSVAPEPRAVVKVPVVPPQLDRFGNPVGPNIGLGRDGEFQGKKLLFWCAFENAGRVFFAPNNPLWKALEAKGFVVSRVFGKFNPAWLKEADQLWILSSGRMELPAGITPDLLADAVSLLPPAAVPSGFTLQEYQFIVRATLDVAFSPRHMLDERAYKAIEEFVKAGKGLCLLADDEPFTAEADELARRLFGARVGGNYMADRVATVRGRGFTPAELRKFGAQFEVDDHALLTGVNFLFEGITVSHVTQSDKLEPALKGSDGKTLLAVSKVAGQRVVIDCGFTRYCHGPTERTSYIFKTAGTVRLAQNIAAFLAGNDTPKKP